MKKLLISAAALVVLFAACKDDDTNPGPQTEVTKLFLNSVSEEDSISMTYDARGKVVTYDIRPVGTSTFTYFSGAVYENGKVTKVNVSYDSPTALLLAQSIEYNAAGQAVKLKFYDEGGAMLDYDSITYDNNGRLHELYLSELGGDMKFYLKYAYVWEEGNITKMHSVKMLDGKATTDTVTTTYTYDNKVNYGAKQPELFLVRPEPFGSSLTANNVLTEKTGDAQNGTTRTKEYTYDEDNYPVTVKSTYVKMKDGKEVQKSVSNTRIRYIKK